VKKVNIGRIHSILKKLVLSFRVPIVDFIEMQTKDPFKVLVSTMLSARTKDETTTEACRKLFRKVKNPSDLDKYSARQLERLIYPVGFYRTKAKNLKKLAGALKNRKVPDNIEELVKLPGVGRKTANLVVVIAFGKHGVCVDTHVHRIMNRFGYVRTKTPHETEAALRKKLPKRYWLSINSILVAFGQHLCRPVSPRCSKCPVRNYCNRAGVTRSR